MRSLKLNQRNDVIATNLKVFRREAFAAVPQSNKHANGRRI